MTQLPDRGQPFTIHHSRTFFTSIRFDFDKNRYVWPIDEFLARTKCSAFVEQRLREMNPNGVVEGEYPLGGDPNAW